MDQIQTGESQQTNPAVTTQDSGLMSQEQPTRKSHEDDFAALMDSASARMAGVPPKQPEPAPAPQQDKPIEVAEDKPAATPEQPVPEAPKVEEQQAQPQPETPRIVKLRVDGQEIEVPEDRLVSLAQQGLDYTKKSQALAEQRRQMEAWQAVINRVQTDPAFAARFQGLFVEQQQPQAAAPAPQEEPPADPVERLKWEIVNAAVAKSQEAILGQVKPMTEQQAAIQHAMRLQAVKSDVMRDPAYADTMQMVRSYVESQPTAFRERIFKTLDQDPQAFMEVYGQARDRVMAMRQQQTQAPTQPVQPPVQPQPQATPQPAPQVERKVTPREAPKLESAGQGVPQTTESAARAQSLKDIRKRVLSGKSTANDLGAFLEATGAIGRMTKR